jgi:hypothetical protein
MSRDLTNGVVAEVEAAELQPFLLFEGNFSTGTVRAWSGIGDLSWNGQTWVGTGTLLQVSQIQENAETVASGATITLSGVPTELISLALGSVRQGRAGKIYLGFFSSGSIVTDPVLVFEGKLDVPVIEEDGDTATIAIAYESRLIDLQKPRESRYTNEDQQRVYPGDLGFEFVPSLQEKTLNWGRA